LSFKLSIAIVEQGFAPRKRKKGTSYKIIDKSAQNNKPAKPNHEKIVEKQVMA